jgi:V/A-type H+/Na+-transporting ATPase subunit I
MTGFLKWPEWIYPPWNNIKIPWYRSWSIKRQLHNTAREAEDRLMILEGWVPKELAGKINHYLDASSAAYITSEATPDDKAPILLKNKGFAEKFEKLGELYSLPSYKELDITPFFAPFYALFFGFCLGDVGYGILLAVGAMAARGKVPKELKPVTVLVFYLGTGNYSVRDH